MDDLGVPVPQPKFRTDKYVYIHEDIYDPEVWFIHLLEGDDEPCYDSSMPIPTDPYPLFCNVRSDDEFKAMLESAKVVAHEEGGLDIVMMGVCVHCRKAIGQDYYMVEDDVWQEAQVHERSELHLHCLETRIGRRLVVTDFTDAPVNRLIHYGFSLGLPEC